MTCNQDKSVTEYQLRWDALKEEAMVYHRRCTKWVIATVVFYFCLVVVAIVSPENLTLFNSALGCMLLSAMPAIMLISKRNGKTKQMNELNISFLEQRCASYHKMLTGEENK